MPAGHDAAIAEMIAEANAEFGAKPVHSTTRGMHGSSNDTAEIEEMIAEADADNRACKAPARRADKAEQQQCAVVPTASTLAR